MSLLLDALWPAFQPVVNLESGQVIGHEVLVRGPAGSPWEAPALIFSEASRLGQQRAVEETCRRLAFSARRRLPPDQILFMNVDMQEPGLPLRPRGRCVHPENVVIEISEQQEILNNPGALELVRTWRAAGHRIVLDDYGTGHASLGTMLAIQPDMVKIDRFIMAGLDHDRRRREAIAAVAHLAREMGVTVVVEGVETIAEMRALRKLGIDYAQGFLLGRPAPEPAGSLCAVVAQEGRLRQTVRAVAGKPEVAAGERAVFDQTLLDSFTEAIYYVDRRRTLLQWNRAAEEISGFTRLEVVGRRCMDHILDHEDLEGTKLCSALCPLVHAMADGEPRQDVVRLQHKDGHRQQVVTLVIPVRRADGHIVGALEVFRPAADVAGEGQGAEPEIGALHLRPELTALLSAFSGQRRLADQ